MELTLNLLSMLRHPIDVYFLTRCICLNLLGKTRIVPKRGAERNSHSTKNFRLRSLEAFCILRIMAENTGDNEYLPINDEFIPPTNFAVIEKGLYRSMDEQSICKIGAFPVKRNFPFLRHLGIKSILYAFFDGLLTYRVLVPEEYPEDSIKFMKKYNIQLFKYPLVGNKVCT